MYIVKQRSSQLLTSICILTILLFTLHLLGFRYVNEEAIERQRQQDLLQAIEESKLQKQSQLDTTELPKQPDLTKRELDNYKTEHDFLIVATANYGHKDFVLNWAESLRRNLNNTEKYLVICFDTNLYTFLQERNIPSVPLPRLIKSDTVKQIYEYDTFKNEEVFGSETYKQIVHLKVDVVKELIEKFHLKILFSDVDLVIINSDTINYIEKLHQDYNIDMTFTRDDYYNEDWLCTGFYSVLPTELSLKIFTQSAEDKQRYQTGNQVVINKKIEQLQADEKKKVGKLDLVLFQNGQSYDIQKEINNTVIPWILHANYRIGFTDKKQLLYEAGYWYID